MDKYIVELIVGDWSNDGHGQTDVTVIESNLTPSEVKAAYSLGVDKCGYGLFEG